MRGLEKRQRVRNARNLLQPGHSVLGLARGKSKQGQRHQRESRSHGGCQGRADTRDWVDLDTSGRACLNKLHARIRNSRGAGIGHERNRGALQKTSYELRYAAARIVLVKTESRR